MVDDEKVYLTKFVSPSRRFVYILFQNLDCVNFEIGVLVNSVKYIEGKPIKKRDNILRMCVITSPLSY